MIRCLYLPFFELSGLVKSALELQFCIVLCKTYCSSQAYHLITFLVQMVSWIYRVIVIILDLMTSNRVDESSRKASVSTENHFRRPGHVLCSGLALLCYSLYFKAWKPFESCLGRIAWQEFKGALVICVKETTLFIIKHLCGVWCLVRSWRYWYPTNQPQLATKWYKMCRLDDRILISYNLRCNQDFLLDYWTSTS